MTAFGRADFLPERPGLGESRRSALDLAGCCWRPCTTPMRMALGGSSAERAAEATLTMLGDKLKGARLCAYLCFLIQTSRPRSPSLSPSIASPSSLRSPVPHPCSHSRPGRPSRSKPDPSVAKLLTVWRAGRVSPSLPPPSRPAAVARAAARCQVDRRTRGVAIQFGLHAEAFPE